MHNLAVQIVRFVGSDFPGWVECELVDAEGRRHILKDKVPLFTVEVLDAGSKYPTPGTVLCEVLERYQDEQGQEFSACQHGETLLHRIHRRVVRVHSSYKSYNFDERIMHASRSRFPVSGNPRSLSHGKWGSAGGRRSNQEQMP